MISTQSFYNSSPKLDTSINLKILKSVYESYLDGDKEVISKMSDPKSYSLYKSLDLSMINEEKGVFTFEKNGGKRYYFIHSYSSLFDLYRSCPTPHLYEVIVEDRPCHLYFDVEYHFDEHPEYNGNEMVEYLISTVEDKLFEVFGIDQYDLIHLDATSPNKFSRHLIFRSDFFCFQNNRQVSTFVHKEILTDEKLALIVDPAVYSRNRNFRCIWSTKFANNEKYPLLPSDGKNQSPKESNLEYFKKTLITYVGSNPHCIGYPEEQNLKWSHMSNTTTGKDSNGFISIPTIGNQDFKCIGIEQFSLAVFAPNGMIKSAKYSPQFNTLTFIIKGCRYCHHIGREHKSNSIYLVAHLSNGTIVQRCFDPDCRGFQSSPVTIPEQIYKQLKEQYTDNPEYNKIDFQPKKVKSEIYLKYNNENDNTNSES